jgi:ribonuclease-3
LIFFRHPKIPNFFHPDFKKFLKKTIGYSPSDYSLYFQAFTHSSFNNKRKQQSYGHNERLEFLGDQILNTIVGEYLFSQFPHLDEGRLTHIKARFVSRKTLNKLAHNMDLISFIVGDFRGNAAPEDAKGNTLEALVGAIYLDKGFKKTKQVVIERFFDKHLNLLALISSDEDYKSRLVKWAQKNKKTLLFEAEDISESLKERRYKVTVWMDGEAVGSGFSRNKKEAEQDAALQVCSQLYL